jgi:hypothetical protein
MTYELTTLTPRATKAWGNSQNLWTFKIKSTASKHFWIKPKPITSTQWLLAIGRLALCTKTAFQVTAEQLENL